MTPNLSDPITTMFRQASETLCSALQTGTRIQQEAINAWSRPFACTDEQPMGDVRERSQRFLEGSIRLLQKNFDESQRLMDAQCRQSMDLLRKAFDSARADGATDVFEATRQLWQQSLEAMRQSVEQVSKTNVQAVDNWTNFMGNSIEARTDRRPEVRPEGRTDSRPENRHYRKAGTPAGATA